MIQKTTIVTAAAGIALALGAPLVATMPATAAEPAAATSTAAGAEQIDVGGHVFAGTRLTITSSTSHDGVLTVTGTSTAKNADVQIAAGAGYVGAGRTDGAGHFTATIRSSHTDYSIRFGKRVTASLFVTQQQAAWGAVPV